MKKKDLQEMTKQKLLILARERGLPGRSKMNKAELVEALGQNQRSRKKQPAADIRKREKSRKSILRSDIGGRPVRRKAVVQETFQQEVEQGRFDLGVREVPHEPEPVFEHLPAGYGGNKIVLMVRDPHWLYSYWEIQEERVNDALTENRLSGSPYQTILRVYTGAEGAYHDMDVEGLANNWYLNVGQPNTDVFVDFGLRVQERFIPLVRSNGVRTPRDGMSEVVDEQWMTLEEESLMMYALSGGFRIGRGEGSAELQQRMGKRLESEISSGAISSFFGSGGFRERPARGFWYHLDAELIVYGATEPDATVVLQGEPLQLRPDGTFTIRLALPDGRQEIPVTFISADEIDRATITPDVTRKTRRS
jgi:hypothetical protein